MDHARLANIGASIASLAFIQGSEKRKRDGLSNSQNREFKCVQPYDRKTATNRDRIKSCKDGDVVAERGYENVPKTRQECVNNCHLDSTYFQDDFGVLPYDAMKKIYESIEDDKLGDMMDTGRRYREIGKEYLPAACERYLQNEEEIGDICKTPKNSTQSKCKENGMCDRVLYKMNQVIVEKEGPVLRYRIPHGIELILKVMDWKWMHLNEIIIPNSVTKIGNAAFLLCTRLESVTIPASVTEIGKDAFMGCSRLASISIPNSVTSIGEMAFTDCNQLPIVNLPNSITKIARMTFAVCVNLTTITIPDSVTEIEDFAFRYCRTLPLVRIPDSVNKIGKMVFTSCTSLATVNIPPSVTEINEGTFSQCKSLSEIIIPDQVKSLGNGAFYMCTSLASISIPDNVTEIGYQAFSSCDNLQDVTLPRHFRYRPDMVQKAFDASVIDRIQYR